MCINDIERRIIIGTVTSVMEYLNHEIINVPSLILANLLPFIYLIRDDSTVVTRLFSESFVVLLIPCLIIGALFGIVECITKIIKQRYTLLVCSAVILSNLVNIALSAYLLTRPVILSSEFTSYMQSQTWGDMDILRFMGNTVDWRLSTILLVIIVVCSLANCIITIVKTIRSGGLKPVIIQ